MKSTLMLLTGLLLAPLAAMHAADPKVFDISPFHPPSGPAQRLFQEPPAKSNFLAVIYHSFTDYRRGASIATRSWLL